MKIRDENPDSSAVRKELKAAATQIFSMRTGDQFDDAGEIPPGYDDDSKVLSKALRSDDALETLIMTARGKVGEPGQYKSARRLCEINDVDWRVPVPEVGERIPVGGAEPALVVRSSVALNRKDSVDLAVVTRCQYERDFHRYVTHTLNVYVGGFFSGHYSDGFVEAMGAHNARLAKVHNEEEFGPHEELEKWQCTDPDRTPEKEPA